MNKLLVTVLVLSVLVSGCVDFSVEQVIREDRSSDVAVTMNMSRLMQSTMAMAESYGNESVETEEDLCADFNASEYTCVQTGDYTIEVSMDMVVSRDYLTIEDSLLEERYVLDARVVFDILDGMDLEDFDIPTLRQSDSELTYTVTLPAPITDAGNAEILSERTATMDVLMMSRNTAEPIIATNKNTGILYALYGVAALILIAVLYFVVMRVLKHRREEQVLSAAPDAVQLSAQERRFKQYIEQYKATYPRESLKDALMKAGLSAREAENYLNKYL